MAENAVLRNFCRYENTVSTVPEETEEYEMTLDDLYSAVNKCLETGKVNDLIGNWLMPMYELIMERNKVFLFREENDTGLPDAASVLHEIWNEMSCSMTLADVQNYHDRIALFYENEKKPPMERILRDDQKKVFLDFWKDRYDQADDTVIQLYRKYLEELCEKDDADALKRKAFDCYGNGSGFYACDWHTARDCLLRWYAKTGSSLAGNALGYIYYYGRCTDGEPEYEQAFRWFSIGAAGGYYESRYKLTDMFIQGLGVHKNDKAAANMILELYDQILPEFLQGKDDTHMADIAFRMAKLHMQGIDTAVSYEAAYYYCLQARYAMDLRMRNAHFFGDDSVSAKISQIQDELASRLDLRSRHKVYSMYTLYYFLHYALDGKNRISMKIRTMKNGSLKLKLQILPNDLLAQTQYFLITVPSLHFCARMETVTVSVKDVSEIKTAGKSDTIVFNEIQGTHFYLYGVWQAEIGGVFEFRVSEKMRSI